MKILGSYPKSRLRRLRKSKWIRDLVSETSISSKDLILPIFVREGKNKIETIKSMPGVKRYSVDKLPDILKKVKLYKIPLIALFPYTPNDKKDKLDQLNKSYIQNIILASWILCLLALTIFIFIYVHNDSSF